MDHFSNAVLERAHRFLLEIHAEGDVEAQRQLIPQRLSQLILGYRAALNEFEVGENRSIIPNPVPAHWTNLATVLREHIHEQQNGRPPHPFAAEKLRC